MREIFARASSVVGDEALRTRLDGASAGAEPTLLVSALQAENRALRKLLGELHAAIEEDPRPEARAVDDAIWRELAASNRRRTLAFAPI